MIVTLGKEGLNKSWQEPFPLTTQCCKCKGESSEGIDQNEENYVCHLHKNNDGYWLHDCCTVAVYFCKKCLEPTALSNQA